MRRLDEHGGKLQARAMTVVTLDNFVALAQASHRCARILNSGAGLAGS